jgi:LysR family transcriptional regulator, nod-box dependent transcriptional activator
MHFRNLDLNLLVVLDALLDEQSVSKTAERLNLTQPAISNALARLRQHFQDDLLVRLGRQLVPTPLAQALHGPVRDALLQIQSIADARPSFDPKTEQRQFVVVSSDYVAATLLTEAVRRLAATAPGIALASAPLTDRNLMGLVRGEADLLIAPQSALIEAHPSRRLFEERFTCIAWDKNADAKSPMTLKQYLGHTHVVASFEDARMAPFDTVHLRTLGHERRIGGITASFTLLPYFIVGTPYLATIHTRLAKVAAHAMPLKILPPRIDFPVITEWLQWHRNRERDPANLWLREFIAEIAARI